MIALERILRGLEFNRGKVRNGLLSDAGVNVVEFIMTASPRYETNHKSKLTTKYDMNIE